MDVRTQLEAAFPKHCYANRDQLNDLITTGAVS